MNIYAQSAARFKLTRREFITLSTASVAGWLAGCATDSVTGRKRFILVGEAGEINLDRQNSPHQISADYGALQDQALNKYIASIGEALAAKSHRPNMPYTFRGVNAVYVNAYAFPGGTIAVTRGMLLNMENEAELAAVLGHEIGHVCAEHTAEQMTSGYVISALVTGAAAAVQYKYEQYGDLTAGLGMVAAGALLAKYSRANEREADALSLEYVTRAGYSPEGCIGVMEILRKLSKSQPNVIEIMFATHPMSEERYQTAQEQVRTVYQAARSLPLNREQYMDQTAKLRAAKDAIEQLQNGEKAMLGGKFDAAVTCFEAALKQVPDDYAGLLMLAKCRLVQKRTGEAESLAEAAKSAYPREAQACHIAGMAKLQSHKFEAAYRDFSEYERRLPGNPNTVYFKGYALEGMQQRDGSAQQYLQYLQMVQQGEQAQHAYRRLVEWGYIKPQPGR